MLQLIYKSFQHQRNITLPMEYGRDYRFGLFPYAGQAVGIDEEVTHTRAILCMHTHLEEHGVADRDAVIEYCSETQSIASKEPICLIYFS